MKKYSLTEHGGTTLFPSTELITEHLDSKYSRTYTYKKHRSRVEVLSNGSVVGVIKKIGN